MSDDMGTATGSKVTISRSQLAVRRAVLIFAEATPVELARRAFPNAVRPLLKLPVFDTELSHGIDVLLFTSGHGSIPDGSHVHRPAGHEFATRLEYAIARRIDLVLLDEAPAPLAYRIFRDGHLLVERDHGVLVARKARALLDYLDWKPVEERCTEGILRAAAGGR